MMEREMWLGKIGGRSGYVFGVFLSFLGVVLMELLRTVLITQF